MDFWKRKDEPLPPLPRKEEPTPAVNPVKEVTPVSLTPHEKKIEPAPHEAPRGAVAHIG